MGRETRLGGWVDEGCGMDGRAPAVVPAARAEVSDGEGAIRAVVEGRLPDVPRALMTRRRAMKRRHISPNDGIPCVVVQATP